MQSNCCIRTGRKILYRENLRKVNVFFLLTNQFNGLSQLSNSGKVNKQSCMNPFHSKQPGGSNAHKNVDASIVKSISTAFF